MGTAVPDRNPLFESLVDEWMGNNSILDWNTSERLRLFRVTETMQLFTHSKFNFIENTQIKMVGGESSNKPVTVLRRIGFGGRKHTYTLLFKVTTSRTFYRAQLSKF